MSMKTVTIEFRLDASEPYQLRNALDMAQTSGALPTGVTWREVEPARNTANRLGMARRTREIEGLAEMRGLIAMLDAEVCALQVYE